MRIIGTVIDDETKRNELGARLADHGMSVRALDPDQHPQIDDLAAIVVDTCSLEDTDADDLVARLVALGKPVLVVFRLGARLPYRVRRETLLLAGAGDVIQEGSDDNDLVIRLRSLCLLNEKPRVLVVDDDKNIATWVADELGAIGMNVTAVHTLGDARAAFQAGPVDALIVDRQLPDGDGIEFVAELRRARIATPALLYTAMTEIADRVDGLERAGADDYLCKPTHADELRARVRVLLRPRLSEDQLIFGPLELSRKDRIVRWRGTRIDMRPRETAMLIYLAERQGLAIPQQMLYLDIWEKIYMEIGSNPVSATKHRMISGLRKHVESQGEDFNDFIETGGFGYCFQPEPLLNLATVTTADDAS